MTDCRDRFAEIKRYEYVEQCVSRYVDSTIDKAVKNGFGDRETVSAALWAAVSTATSYRSVFQSLLAALTGMRVVIRSFRPEAPPLHIELGDDAPQAWIDMDETPRTR